MKYFFAAVGCILSMHGHTGGAQAIGRYEELNPVGPVKSIVHILYNDRFGTVAEGRREYTFHRNGRLATYRWIGRYSSHSSVNEAPELRYSERYDERGVLVERGRKDGDDYVYDDLVVGENRSAAIAHFRTGNRTYDGERTTDSTRGSGVVRRTGRDKHWDTEEVYEYSYDDLDRLSRISLVSAGKRITRKTVFYDGVRRGFDTPYYVTFDSVRVRQSLIGHEEIEVYDGDALVFAARRHRFMGDIKPPDTTEEAEAQVLLVEYLFDRYGNETYQFSYVGGEKYGSCETKYTEYDQFGNWIHRIITTVMPGGERRQTQEEQRRIAYYE